MLGESQQLRVEGERAGHSVMPVDERPGVVEQHLLRHAAELRKRAFQPIEPAFLALVQEGADVEAARVAERGHEQKHLKLYKSRLDLTVSVWMGGRVYRPAVVRQQSGLYSWLC